MKKLMFLLMFTAVLLCSVIGLVACNSAEQNTPDAHKCEHQCTICHLCTDLQCREKVCLKKCLGHAEPCRHTNTKWIVDVEPTCIKEGAKHEICMDCGETLVVKATIAVTNHNYVDGACSVCGAPQGGSPDVPDVPDVPIEHKCNHVCETCQKCTDLSCTDDVCAEKCTGHTGTEACLHENTKWIVDEPPLLYHSRYKTSSL